MKISGKAGAVLSAAAMLLTCAPLPAGAAPQPAYGLQAMSTGTQTAAACLRGSGAEIVHDAARDSDVLDLHGTRFGDGWLELPALFGDGCSEGFTFSMQCRLSGDTPDYSRLFQFSPLPFGTGNAPSYSSPDISMDVQDKAAFRSSLFAGTGFSAADDKRHRAIFSLDVAPDPDAWHQITLVCAPSGAAYYIDGKEIGYTSETAGDAAASLFAEGALARYVYNAVGHSVYTDKDLRAQIDDVAFYSRPLSASEMQALPADADYLYTFEADTMQGSTALPAAETAVNYRGAKLTGLPALTAVSPDGRLVTKFWTESGKYYYSVHKASGETVIEPSQLGITTTTEDLSSGFDGGVPSVSVISHDETYTQPCGKHTVIRDHYNEYSFPLQKGDTVMTVTFRMYDDGIGFRYSISRGETIKSEQSEMVFPENSTFWGNWPNATYEWDMVELPMQKVTDAWADYSCPLAGRVGDHSWILVSEANVFNEENPYCAGCVCTTGGSRALRWKFGVKAESVKMNGAFHTPWRAVIIGDTLDAMASSDLIPNLNPPSALTDTSWIHPGKTAWSWWSSGGDSPIEYHTQKDYIDFAAENGWEFVCLDFGWALWDDSAAKVKELCEYGAERGVGIWLWYGVNNTGHEMYKDSAGHTAYPYYSLLDEATIVREFERISALGVKGVKVDYYESDTQETMRQMHLCAEIAAKNKLMVLFHGCTVPRGECRTYPHILSTEAINGSEYYKWFESPSLENRVSYPFTRCVVGSADFTPTGIPVYGIKATAGFALADTVAIESGIQHFAQSVYTYEGSSALPLLNDVPVKWDDMKILDGYPMQFNVTARRSGDDWFISMASIQARTVEIPLAELIGSGTYRAYIFADNADGSDLEVTTLENLTSADTISRRLLANGGCVIKLTQGSMKLTSPYTNYRSYEAEDAILTGQASVTAGKQGKYCSNAAYVGYVGGKAENAVTFDHVTADQAGTYTLRIYYVSGEPRSLKVDVNGRYIATLDGLYANRNDWSGIRAVNVEVPLQAGKNTVKLYNDTGWGPSIDRIALAIPEDQVIGDLNFDGVFDLRDVILMNRYLVCQAQFSARQFAAADLTGDGQADIFDLAVFKHMLLQ